MSQPYGKAGRKPQPSCLAPLAPVPASAVFFGRSAGKTIRRHTFVGSCPVDKGETPRVKKRAPLELREVANNPLETLPELWSCLLRYMVGSGVPAGAPRASAGRVCEQRDLFSGVKSRHCLSQTPPLKYSLWGVGFSVELLSVAHPKSGAVTGFGDLRSGADRPRRTSCKRPSFRSKGSQKNWPKLRTKWPNVSPMDGTFERRAVSSNSGLAGAPGKSMA